MSHSYSTNSPERRHIPFFLAAAAIASAFFVSQLFQNYHIELPWWASPPVDTMAFYGFFYLLFDRFIWKWSWVHRLKITRIPDLSGEWRGTVNPTQTNAGSASSTTPAEIALTIHQTWTEMVIMARTELSKSRSLSGHLLIGDEATVSYEYLNEPSANAPSTMHAHRGTVWLAVLNKSLVLEGEYYSGRDRQNVGTIRVTRM